jgi:hypothetical protein
MKTNSLPLKEQSISEIYNGNKATYEVPIYQRNYAWEKDEIFTLIQDVYDSFHISKDKTYYIGTLVTFHKGDQVYEVIDGQQRLTTSNIILNALGVNIQNKLTYRARKKSNATINNFPNFLIDEKDDGIVNGFRFAKESIKEIIPTGELKDFTSYFLNHVHIIHYQVPKDLDLNHYFEVMNSRGEQLEKHEIIKARLIEKLNDNDKIKFNHLWECCSELNVYIQQKYPNSEVFGAHLNEFKKENFDDLPSVDGDSQTSKILDLLHSKNHNVQAIESEKNDTFQPIIDFSNFLLIVLKMVRLSETDFVPTDFNLDDKDLIKEFNEIPEIDESFVKNFGFQLLKSRYFLDNYMVHHSNEEDTIENNPWNLQYWYDEGPTKRYLKNIDGESNSQKKLVQLLSMFEVSFTARQRKNYLFYCLLYLNTQFKDVGSYCLFVSSLADKFIRDVYLVGDNLNEINVPKPGVFDDSILGNGQLNTDIKINQFNFATIYGNGSEASKGIPLFIFNYLDYKIWELYTIEIQGEKLTKGSKVRQDFFESLGCSDFGQDVFNQFYFSRTRRSLEHFYPQANVSNNNSLDENQINCLGNYAMIGSEANSSGSNWSPISKLNHYLDSSGKIKQVSVASLKFMIMMQSCKDNYGKRNPGEEWNFEDILDHQTTLLKFLN